jgi:hypothetical protein
MGRVVVDLSPVNLSLSLSNDAVWSFNRIWCVPVLPVLGSSTLHARVSVELVCQRRSLTLFFSCALHVIKRLFPLFFFSLVLPSSEWPPVSFTTDSLFLNAYHVQLSATMALHRLSAPYI